MQPCRDCHPLPAYHRHARAHARNVDIQITPEHPCKPAGSRGATRPRFMPTGRPATAIPPPPREAMLIARLPAVTAAKRPAQCPPAAALPPTPGRTPEKPNAKPTYLVEENTPAAALHCPYRAMTAVGEKNLPKSRPNSGNIQTSRAVQSGCSTDVASTTRREENAVSQHVGAQRRTHPPVYPPNSPCIRDTPR